MAQFLDSLHSCLKTIPSIRILNLSHTWSFYFQYIHLMQQCDEDTLKKVYTEVGHLLYADFLDRASSGHETPLSLVELSAGRMQVDALSYMAVQIHRYNNVFLLILTWIQKCGYSSTWMVISLLRRCIFISGLSHWAHFLGRLFCGTVGQIAHQAILGLY